jgi:hypothetical protein
MRLTFAAAGLVLAASLSLTAPAMAEMVNFKADLKGANEVPANTLGGSGSVTATYDTASKKLTYKGSYSGLSGPATAGHFHGPAGPTQNAAVAVAIPDATKTSFEGSATLTDAQAADLMAGRWYANIHTEANKGGEIRGQMTK